MGWYGELVKPADCKSVTLVVNIAGSSPARPTICSRVPTGRGIRFKPGSVRVQSLRSTSVGAKRTSPGRSAPLREYVILSCPCSRIGICGGLRTRAGLRSIVSSSLTRDTYAGVTERNTYLSQAQVFEGSNPFSRTEKISPDAKLENEHD